MPGLAAAVRARAQPAQRDRVVDRLVAVLPDDVERPAARSAWIGRPGLTSITHRSYAVRRSQAGVGHPAHIGPTGRTCVAWKRAILARGEPRDRSRHEALRRDRRTRRADLRGRPGEVFGFLGANGAGKTTTMRICLGILRADAGEIRWDGRPTGRPAAPDVGLPARGARPVPADDRPRPARLLRLALRRAARARASARRSPG